MLRSLLVLFLLIQSFTAYAESSLKLIYISRTPDISMSDKGVGGLVELGGLLRQSRSEGSVFFLHGGDFLAPSAMSAFDHGSHMIDILNSLEPDAVTVNERELAYKEDELVLRIKEAGFPFVSSNITDPLTGKNLEGVLNNYCNKINDINVCVISYLDPSVNMDYMPDRIIVDPDISHMDELARKLKKNGADVVLMVAGMVNEDIMQMIYSKSVDIMFIVKSQEDQVIDVNGSFLVKQGTVDGNVIVADIKKSADGVSVSPVFRHLLEFPPDPEVSKKVDYYNGKLSDVMSAVIGRTTTEMTTVKRIVRLYENAFGNLTADALRDYYDSDIAFMNSGGIRGNRLYSAGTLLTRGDIQSELPFRNSGILLDITGRQLRDAVENGLSTMDDVKGRFLHFSGVKMAYCPEKPVGSRVVSITINGKPLKDDKIYRAATADFMANGGDGFSMLKDARVVQGKKASMLIWEIVREYVQNKNVVSPKIEGRILTKCP